MERSNRDTNLQKMETVICLQIIGQPPWHVCLVKFLNIICTHIRHHLDIHNILSKLQHGFKSKHSCVSQLTITINDLLKHGDKRTQIDMAILDFSKAFDTVPHQRLLGKLSCYGIKGPLLNWIAAFLKDRHQHDCGSRGDNIGPGTSRL